MQRIIIAILALGIATASTVAIYLRWKVVERDAQIEVLERTTVTARQASERAAAQAAEAKAALQLATEEVSRLKAALKASRTAMLRPNSP